MSKRSLAAAMIHRGEHILDNQARSPQAVMQAVDSMGPQARHALRLSVSCLVAYFSIRMYCLTFSWGCLPAQHVQPAPSADLQQYQTALRAYSSKLAAIEAQAAALRQQDLHAQRASAKAVRGSIGVHLRACSCCCAPAPCQVLLWHGRTCRHWELHAGVQALACSTCAMSMTQRRLRWQS